MTTLICYGGAAILAVSAIVSFAGHLGSGVTAWLLFIAGIVLVAVGVNTSRELQEKQRLVTRATSDADLTRTQLERQRSAIDSLADGLEIGVFICDSRATVLYANRRAIELFRIDNAIGRSILAITLSYDLEQLVLEAFRSKETKRGEMTFAYPIERTGIANAWPEDGGDRVFLSIYDITDLRRLERIRQDFVSNVSHELRTPLTIIRSMAETLLDDDVIDQELSQRYLPKVISEVDRLSMISNDLLILSAAESNPVRKQRCDVAELFRSTLEQLTQKAKDKGLTTEFEGPKNMLIEANTSQMTQVAINLIDNAINYTLQGSVKVSVLDEGEEAVIAISDTGVGIPSEQVSRIFERFYRVDKARTRTSGGTGLGLSIVKHIVESHGGRVTVDSALNEGSTFTVRLPKGNPVETEST